MTYRYDNEQAEFCECGGMLNDDGQCVQCDDEYEYNDGLSDVEADAMTLRDAGYGTDEDYGYYGGDYDEW